MIDDYKKKIEESFNYIVESIEEDRFYPSEKGAGDAPTDYALEGAYSILIDLIEDLSQYDIKQGDLSGKYTLADIMQKIEESQLKNISSDFSEALTLVKDKSSDNIFIYKHFSGKYLKVEEIRAVKKEKELDSKAKKSAFDLAFIDDTALDAMFNISKVKPIITGILVKKITKKELNL